CQDLHSHGKGYLWVENTPEEILNVVEEALSQEDAYSYSNLQKIFMEERQNQVHRWFNEGQIWEVKSWDTHGKFRIACRVDPSKATMGKEFLEKNWSQSSKSEIR